MGSTWPTESTGVQRNEWTTAGEVDKTEQLQRNVLTYTKALAFFIFFVCRVGEYVSLELFCTGVQLSSRACPQPPVSTWLTVYECTEGRRVLVYSVSTCTCLWWIVIVLGWPFVVVRTLTSNYNALFHGQNTSSQFSSHMHTQQKDHAHAGSLQTLKRDVTF